MTAPAATPVAIASPVLAPAALAIPPAAAPPSEPKRPAFCSGVRLSHPVVAIVAAANKQVVLRVRVFISGAECRRPEEDMTRIYLGRCDDRWFHWKANVRG